MFQEKAVALGTGSAGRPGDSATQKEQACPGVWSRNELEMSVMPFCSVGSTRESRQREWLRKGSLSGPSTVQSLASSLDVTSNKQSLDDLCFLKKKIPGFQ